MILKLRCILVLLNDYYLPLKFIDRKRLCWKIVTESLNFKNPTEDLCTAYIRKLFGFRWFYGTSTIVGYLMPNHIYIWFQTHFVDNSFK